MPMAFRGRKYCSQHAHDFRDSDVNLLLPVSPTNRDDMEWVHYLHIPIRLLIPPSLRPFKLLRYMCFSIVAARGHLSFSREHLDSVPYDSPCIDIPPDGNLDIYYHLDADQQPHVFSINPIFMPNTPTSSVCSSNDSQIINFRTDVANRDGTCVGSDMPADLCEATHLIGITKGDEGIRKLMESRSVNAPNPQCISDINDVRNGLFVNLIMHDWLGVQFALLPIPNIYMDAADIRVDSPPPTKSYILHNFQPMTHGSLSFHQYPNFKAPDVTSDDWPPDILFDAVYASALCKTWGSESFRSAWNDEFYGGLSKVQGERAQITQTQQCNDNEEDECCAWRDRREEFLLRRDFRHDRRKDRRMNNKVMSAPWLNMEGARNKAVQSKVHEWLESSRQDGIE